MILYVMGIGILIFQISLVYYKMYTLISEAGLYYWFLVKPVWTGDSMYMQ